MRFGRAWNTPQAFLHVTWTSPIWLYEIIFGLAGVIVGLLIASWLIGTSLSQVYDVMLVPRQRNRVTDRPDARKD